MRSRGCSWRECSLGAGVGFVMGLAPSVRGYSARSPREHAEEGLDVGVGGRVAVAVEVGAAAGGAAVAGEAGEERFDVGVGADISVGVEVGGAAGGDEGGDAKAGLWERW